MATLISCADGNFTAAATWALCNSTAENDSIAANTALTTSPVASSAFSPGAITVDGVAVRIATRAASPTGTITIELYNSSDSISIASRTINVSDIDSTVSDAQFPNRQLGWYFFKFASTYLLTVGKNYTIRASTSSASQVNLFSSATTNWSRQLRTTTTQAPASGDKLIIIGEHTGAGTGNNFTVTMDNTATTSFGAVAFNESLQIGKRGTCTFGITASTNYYLKIKGILAVCSSGTLNIGTVANPMSSTSTAVLEFDSTVAGDSGILVLNGGTNVIQGNALTYDRCRITADVGGYCSTSGTTVTRLQGQSFTGMTGNIIINGVTYTISSVTNSNTLVLTGTAGTQTSVNYILSSSTSLTTDVSTGWLSGDSIAISATRYASTILTDNESRTLSVNASGTTLTVDAMVAPHIGSDSNYRAYLANLTRNIKIRGVSSSLTGFFYLSPLSSADYDWAEFYWIGISGTNKSGLIYINTTTGSCIIQRCSFHDVITGVYGINVASGTSSGVIISNNVFFNACGAGAYVVNNAATSGTNTFDSNLIIKSVQYGLVANDNGSIYTNNIIIGCTNNGLLINEPYGIIGTDTFNGNILACNNIGFGISSGFNGTISNIICWRNNINVNLTGLQKTLLNNFTCYGGAGGVSWQLGAGLFDCVINNLINDAGITTGCVNIYGLSTSFCHKIYFINCSFGATTAFSTADMYGASAYGITFYNCTFTSSTLILGSSNYPQNNYYFAFHKFNGTANNHRKYLGSGTIQTDTTIYLKNNLSLRMTPRSLTLPMSSGRISSAVLAGTSITISAYIRKSGVGDGTAYNGNAPKIILKATSCAGITSDLTIATATGAAGSWELLSGSTPIISEDGVLEFVIICDGTTGWINIGDIFISGSQNTSEGKFWIDGTSFISKEPSEFSSIFIG